MRERVLVVKIGGSVVENADRRKAFTKAFAQVPGKKLLVHGGGVLVTQLADRLGIATQMVDGRRVTDTPTLELAVMVYAGLANKQLVAELSAQDCLAIGMSGADANLVRTTKRVHPTVDFGWVGDAPRVNVAALSALWGSGWAPVCCAITHSGDGQLLNTNADTVAGAFAAQLSTQCEVRFAYLFDKPGVLDAGGHLIGELTEADISQLQAAGTIHSGMLPKLKTALAAAQAGASVRIASVDEASALFSEWQQGTLVVAP